MAQNPIITITMENGSVIRAELYPQTAPNSVNNFISLVKKGFYDGLIFHRGHRRFYDPGGCPDGTGMGGPGYTIPGEFSQNGFPERSETRRRRSFYGARHASGLRRQPVLHHA